MSGDGRGATGGASREVEMTSNDKTLLTLMGNVMVACLGRVSGCKEALELAARQAQEWGLDAQPWLEPQGSILSVFDSPIVQALSCSSPTSSPTSSSSPPSFRLTCYQPKDIITALSKVPTISATHSGGARQLRADLQKEYTFKAPVGLHGSRGVRKPGGILSPTLLSPVGKADTDENAAATPVADNNRSISPLATSRHITPDLSLHVSLSPTIKVTLAKDLSIKYPSADLGPKGELVRNAPTFDEMAKRCDDKSNKFNDIQALHAMNLFGNMKHSRNTSVTFEDSNVILPIPSICTSICSPMYFPPISRIDSFMNSVKCS